jgi:ribosomal protein S18 acetylase RimI-like enzyme
MPQGIEIVHIREEHIEGFHACLDSVARERIYIGGVEARPIETTREFVRGNIRDKKPQLVALDGDRVIGWCDILPMRGFDFAHVGQVGMGVHKDYRGKRIGNALMKAALQAAKDFGIERVELEVYTSNTRAINMYEKFGFVTEGVKRKGRKLEGEYFDVQVMALFFDPDS